MSETRTHRYLRFSFSVLLSPLDMLDAVSILLLLPLDLSSLLGVLETLRPAELVGGVLI